MTEKCTFGLLIKSQSTFQNHLRHVSLAFFPVQKKTQKHTSPINHGYFSGRCSTKGTTSRRQGVSLLENEDLFTPSSSERILKESFNFLYGGQRPFNGYPHSLLKVLLTCSFPNRMIVSQCYTQKAWGAKSGLRLRPIIGLCNWGGKLVTCTYDISAF